MKRPIPKTLFKARIPIFLLLAMISLCGCDRKTILSTKSPSGSRTASIITSRNMPEGVVNAELIVSDEKGKVLYRKRRLLEGQDAADDIKEEFSSFAFEGESKINLHPKGRRYGGPAILNLE
jgi:hypothetical protein